MVVAVVGLGLIRPKCNSADTSVSLELNDAELNRAVEDLEAVECSLARLTGCLIRNGFKDYKPGRPAWGIREMSEGTVTTCMNQQFIVGEHGSPRGVVSGRPSNCRVAAGAI